MKNSQTHVTCSRPINFKILTLMFNKGLLTGLFLCRLLAIILYFRLEINKTQMINVFIDSPTMDRVHPEPFVGTPYGPSTNPQYTVLHQSQPPPYPVPPYGNPMMPKPVWELPAPPPPYGSPPMPGSSYPSGYPPPMQLQQQQQQVVIIGGGRAIAPIRYNVVTSYGGQVAVSCLVLWFCNFLFGFIAFVLAGKKLNYTL